MPPLFRREEEIMEFHDPRNDWKTIAQKTEVRFCPLTGRTSRLVPSVPFRAQSPDYRSAAEQTKAVGCPFCPENVERLTPKFLATVHPEGRMRLGEAVLLPNLFPYGQHTAVVSLTAQHYVAMNELKHEILRDGFQLAVQFLHTVRQVDPASNYVSVNWNYMPIAGASIIHPHVQALATPHPSNYQRETWAGAEGFVKENGISYYDWLIREERKRDERWIAENDAVAWVHAFAPLGQVDILGIIKGADDLSRLTPEKIEQLGRDLTLIFAYLHQQGFGGFNLGLFIPVDSPPGMQAHVRIIGRTSLGIVGTSEYNYVNALHQEPICFNRPEETAQEIKKWFETQGN